LDNLTHSLVGLFLARAGFKYATPRGTAILILAANIPDLDVVSVIGGAEGYIRWHRHITHSLIAIPVMALIAVALVRLLGRQPVKWLPAWGIAIVGVASHLLLDLTNIYGVRLLMPFSGRWFHWDLTPVIDPWIWAILLLGIAAPALGRLVGSEIGEHREGAGNGGWAVTVLFLLLCYDYSRSIFHDQAAAQTDAHKYAGLTPRRSGAFPQTSPLKWTGVAELSTSYVMIPIDLISGFHPNDAETFYKAEQTPEVNAARRSEPFQRFQEFVRYPLWVTEPAADLDQGTRVTLVDLRFGIPRAPGFASIATVDRTGRVTESYFTMSGARPR
jgi:inner membrane protein